MKFVSLRDFRTKMSEIRKALKREGEIVLTANGRPTALLVDVNEENFEENLEAVRRTRAREALARIQADAVARGLDRLGAKKIEAVVGESRRRGRRKK